MKKTYAAQRFPDGDQKVKTGFCLFSSSSHWESLFAGIRASGPDMKLSADAYYDAQKLMDIRVLGTLGMTEEDVGAIRSLPGIRRVVPSYSSDVFMNGKDSQYVVKLMSLTEGMNETEVLSGRAA